MDAQRTALIRPGLYAHTTRGQLAEIRRRLRAKVPTLNANDVRRARMPYADAIAAELCETHLPKTADFVEQLLAESQQRSQRPCPQLYDKIVAGLRRAERADRDANETDKIREIVATAETVVTSNGSNLSHAWMATRLFELAVEVAERLRAADRGHMEAFARLHYGAYLTATGSDGESGEQQLRHAYTIAMEINEIVQHPGCPNIVQEVSFLYGQLLLRHIKNVAVYDAEHPTGETFRLVQWAIQVATNSQNGLLIAQCRIVHSICLSRLGRYAEAADTIAVAIRQAYTVSCRRSICAGYFQLALVNLSTNGYLRGEASVRTLLRVATAHGYGDYAGIASLCLGLLSVRQSHRSAGEYLRAAGQTEWHSDRWRHTAEQILAMRWTSDGGDTADAATSLLKAIMRWTLAGNTIEF